MIESLMSVCAVRQKVCGCRSAVFLADTSIYKVCAHAMETVAKLSCSSRDSGINIVKNQSPRGGLVDSP